MTSEVHEIDPVTVEIRVEVPWDRVRKGLDDTYGRLQKTARVKGFRPGKAPRSVLQQLFAKDVRAELVGSLVEESLIEAVKKHEIPVVSNAVMEKAPTFSDGQPLAFTAKFEVRPKIEKLETALTLTRRTHATGDKEVDAEIEHLRSEHAVIEPVEAPRPAVKGDILVIDFDVTIDGQRHDDKGGRDRHVNLGEGRLLTEIESALEGMKPGDEKAISITRPDSDDNKELAGKVVVFDVKVKELRVRRLPDVDDDFAKDVGDYEGLADLRAKLKARLEDAAKARAESGLREEAIDKLVAANPVPVPPSLVDQQLRSMAQEFVQFLRMVGQEPKLDEATVGEMKKRAEDKVRAAILLGDLARRESITVSAAEIDGRLAEIAEKTGKHIAKVRVEHQGEKREALETQILEQKLVDHLFSKATITDAPAEEAAGKSPGTEQKEAG